MLEDTALHKQPKLKRVQKPNTKFIHKSLLLPSDFGLQVIICVVSAPKLHKTELSHDLFELL